MSHVHDTTALPAPAEPAAIASTNASEVSPVESSLAASSDAIPAAASESAMPITHEHTVAPTDGSTADVAPAVPEKAAERSIEPISEGQLAVKGPGFIKQIVPSKKEFWLSDSPVTPQHMDLYMRGEKAETSHAVVAWASQTGKGLLFFNKKGETERTRPHSVLPLYDAVDLKKSHPHEIVFRLHGETHTLKAASDIERDGWFVSLERAVEVGKAEKETIRASEGYRAEMEKLNKPNMTHGGAAAAGASAVRSKSHAKSTDEPRRAGSDPEGVADKHKSRSTSRGVLGKLKGKKDEVESKREIKKEEKQEEKEEKKLEKEEVKAEKHAEKHHDAALLPLAGGATFDAPSTAERALGAPVEESVAEPTPVAEPSPVTNGLPKTEEKPKISKRGSIFGRVQSGWGSMKSPAKEKDLKDAELKPQVPPKDAGVSETAPQIPEPTPAPTHEPTAEPIATDTPLDTSEQVATHGKPAEAAKEALDPLASPPEKKGGFLSSLPFMSKRDRSASPSAMKDTPLKSEDAPAVPPKEDNVPVEESIAAESGSAEPVSAEPAISEPAVHDPIAPVNEAPVADLSAEKPITKAEEPAPIAAADATSPSANKRQSYLGNFGNLGRRASKAFKGMQTPRKENTAPTTAAEPKIEESKIAEPAAERALVNGENKTAMAEQPNSIGDVNPDAIHIGQAQSTPTVSAFA
ncbi:hypothetical protein LTR53_012708 [Teratosphaeriaceae sp. CCFEE 6253]|nr:hypothetical protein LTR53_012708 [Teratosphaeriaceae sp. CCFEE 6253]